MKFDFYTHKPTIDQILKTAEYTKPPHIFKPKPAPEIIQALPGVF